MSARTEPPAEAMELLAASLGIVAEVANSYPGHEDTLLIAAAMKLLSEAKKSNPSALKLFQMSFQVAAASGQI